MRNENYFMIRFNLIFNFFYHFFTPLCVRVLRFLSIVLLLSQANVQFSSNKSDCKARNGKNTMRQLPPAFDAHVYLIFQHVWHVRLPEGDAVSLDHSSPTKYVVFCAFEELPLFSKSIICMHTLLTAIRHGHKHFRLHIMKVRVVESLATVPTFFNNFVQMFTTFFIISDWNRCIYSVIRRREYVSCQLSA